MHKSVVEIIVGLFVLVGLGALLFQSFRVGNLNKQAVSDPYVVHAYFENIGGLKEGAPVTMAGVDIGRIKSLTLDMSSYQNDTPQQLHALNFSTRPAAERSA